MRLNFKTCQQFIFVISAKRKVRNIFRTLIRDVCLECWSNIEEFIKERLTKLETSKTP